MKMVSYDTMGLDMQENPSQVAWAEIRASLVRVCVIPAVMLVKEDAGKSVDDYINVYKAAVMLV